MMPPYLIANDSKALSMARGQGPQASRKSPAPACLVRRAEGPEDEPKAAA